MCDRCGSPEKFTDYDYITTSKNKKMRVNRSTVLCIKCSKEWAKLYHAVYPKGANVWDWNRLFNEFMNQSPEKVLFI